MNTWIVIIAVGVGSYLLRVVPVLTTRPGRPEGARREVVPHAATAALATLVVGGLHRATGPSDLAASVMAAAVGLAVALRWRSMTRVLVAGGVAYAVTVIVLAALL